MLIVWRRSRFFIAFVDLVFQWSNEGVASKAGYDLSSECGDLSNIDGWGEGAVRLGASRSSWTGSPIWKQKNFMEKKENYKVINGGLKNENNINTLV